MKAWLLLVSLLLPEAGVPTLLKVNESSSREDILLAINEAKSKNDNGDELRKAISMWRSRDTVPAYGDEHVRVELADLLVQASNNDEVDISTHDLFLEIRAGVNSSRNEVVTSAVLALSGLDEAQDVNLAEATAKKGPVSVSRMAVASLSRMCNPEAQLALSRLEGQAQDRKFRDFIRTTRNQYAEIKRKSGRCENSSGGE